MELFRDILLGIIQGITGFLPVSSSGHILLLCKLFSMDTGYTTLFLCLLKVSSLAGVFIVLFKDIIKVIIGTYQLILDVFSNILIFIKKRLGMEKGGYFVLDTNPYKKLVLMIVISSAVTCVVSTFIKSIAENSSQIPMIIGVCFIISGIILFLADRLGQGKRNIKNMSVFDAVVIGMAQGLAIMPGISRMVMTFAAAMALGYGKNFAVKYSYLLAIPAILGSALLGLQDLAGTAVSMNNLANILAGMVICGILSCLFIKLMLNLAKRGTMAVFSVYGIVFGLFVVICDLII